jgi:hypothetical protein
MSAAPDPVEPAAPFGTPEISQAAQVARQRLHEEIERVRNGVEEMLDEHDGENGLQGSADSSEIRRELEDLRLETRNYVKKRVRKSEKKLERSMRELDDRTERLERRIDQVAADREAAEVRIHKGTEKMLDGLLREVRSIADRLSGVPAPPAASRPRQAARPGPAPAPTPAQAKPATPPQKPARPAARPAPDRPAQPQRPPGASQGPVGRIGPPARRAAG